MKDLLWIGVGPSSFNPAICAFVPYPLLLAKSYPGSTLSYSTISRSLVTFAIILAAAIEMLFASPLMIGTAICLPVESSPHHLTKVRTHFQIINCHTHCFISGLQNINFINSRRTCHTNPRCYRAVHDLVIQHFTLFFGQLF